MESKLSKVVVGKRGLPTCGKLLRKCRRAFGDELRALKANIVGLGCAHTEICLLWGQKKRLRFRQFDIN